MYERQFGQSAVEQVRQRFDYLHQCRFAYEHCMEHAVLRVGFGVLAYTSARERSVAYVHGEQRFIHQHLSVHYQLHRHRFLLCDGTYQTYDIVDVMRAEIVLQLFGVLAAQWVHAESYGVDEVAVVLDMVTPVGDASYIQRVSFARQEPFDSLTVVLCQVPVASPIVACTAWHEPEFDVPALLGGDLCAHDAVERLG